jgi:MFS family permease
VDLPGQLTAVVGLTALAGATIEAGLRGFGAPVVIGGYLLALLAGGAFVLIERTRARPLLPLRLFRSRTFSVAVCAGLLINVVFYGLIFTFSLFLQRHLGLSPLSAGLAFLPVTVLIMASDLIAGRVIAMLGTRSVSTAGALAMGAGCLAMFAILSAHVPALVAALVAALSVTGFGIGLIVTAITAALLGSVDKSWSGIASGTLTAFRQSGSVLGVALFGSLLAGMGAAAGLRTACEISAVVIAAVAALSFTTPARASRPANLPSHRGMKSPRSKTDERHMRHKSGEGWGNRGKDREFLAGGGRQDVSAPSVALAARQSGNTGSERTQKGFKGMRFSLKGALGVACPALLGTALMVGATALPASAQTYQDTALIGGSVSDATFGGSGLGAVDGNGVITLTGSGVTWSLHGAVPAGVSLSGNTISYSGAVVASPSPIVADGTDSNGNAEALEIPISILKNYILLQGAAYTLVSLSDLSDSNTSGNVSFSATSSESGDAINFAESNLPAGLSSGNPALPYLGGTAAPGNYSGAVVTATDSDGAVLKGTFSLTVEANAVSGSYGDEVNRFGKGFDVFREHQYPGAIIAGWTATQGDPATRFILSNGTHQGAVQFEYAPQGSDSGLCVSDPGGGWSSDPLRDGLILASCNTGPWQQFIPQSNGTLKNVATGMYVNPNGSGAQLRGAASPTPWGGSSYTWTDHSQLAS